LKPRDPRSGAVTKAQYTATATTAGGAEVDVTDRVVWSSSAANVLHATDRAGEMEPELPGIAAISAAIETVKTSIGVRVLEAGTFFVSGVVRAAGGGGLAQATVQVSAGDVWPGARNAYTYDGNGSFTLNGVVGDLELTVTAQGFAPAVRRIFVDRDMTVDIALTAASDPLDISGAWSLTLSESPACRDQLPEAARDRRFDAVITQNSAQVRVLLTGPAIDVRYEPHDQFVSWGFLTGDQLSVVLVGDTEYGTWSTPDLFQRLTDTQMVGIDGSIAADAGRHEIRGRMNGDIEVFVTGVFGFDGRPPYVCRAADHAVVLRRP